MMINMMVIFVSWRGLMNGTNIITDPSGLCSHGWQVAKWQAADIILFSCPTIRGQLEWRQCAFFCLLRMIHSKHCVQFYGCVRSGNTNSVISHSQNLKGRSESEAITQNFFFEPTIFQMQHERCLKQVKEVVSKKISFFEKPSLTMETVSTVIIVYCVVKSSQCKC